MPGRLVLLATSPRVAPGLLTREAWSELQISDVVLVGSADHPLRPELDAAGLSVRVVEPAEGTSAVEAHARTLLAEVDDEGSARGADRCVVWVMSTDGDPGLAEAIVRLAADRPATGVQVELLSGSWDLPGAHLIDLVAVMDRLRSPGGCPWDAQQTHESLVEYLIEESYETVEAIESGDDAELLEELGDLMLQVVFHARIAREHEHPWSIDEVADGIVAKLVARHPHVFGDVDAATAEQVEANWQRHKHAEKGRESVTDGIPLALPSLVLAAKLLKRSVGIDVEAVSPGIAAVADAAFDAAGPSHGELLLALVARARADGVDLDVELRAAGRDYRARVRSAEGVGPVRSSGE